MSYTINLTNGNTLVTLLDGSVDTTASDLTLIGRNYTGFGQYINQDLVKLLENFANSSPPSNPLIGQLWFNTNENNIQVYTSTGWRGSSGPIVADARPLNLVTGDFWLDSRQDQLYFYDGSNLTLAGPVWGKTQGITGLKAETLLDGNNNPYTVLLMYVSNNIFGILSNVDFTPSPTIPGFSTIVKGFQTSNYFPNPFNSSISNALKLNGLTSDEYMKLDRDQVTVGSLAVHNDSGITIGAASEGTVYVPTGTTQVAFKNNSKGSPLVLQTTTSNGVVLNNIYIDGEQKKIGILNDLPSTELDVNGTVRSTNLTITGNAVLGNITVTGSSISATGSGANLGISITTKGTGNIVLNNNPKIQGLAAPVANTDATNKLYVDNTVKSEILSLTFIDNGFESDINGNIIKMLNDIAKPTDYVNGKLAYVHGQHIDFLSSSVSRYLKQFQITSNAWVFVQNLTSSI